MPAKRKVLGVVVRKGRKKTVQPKILPELSEDNVDPAEEETAAVAAAQGDVLPELASNELASNPVARKKSKAVCLSEEDEITMGEWLRQHPEIYAKGLKAYKDMNRKKSSLGGKGGRTGGLAATTQDLVQFDPDKDREIVQDEVRGPSQGGNRQGQVPEN